MEERALIPCDDGRVEDIYAGTDARVVGDEGEEAPNGAASIAREGAIFDAQFEVACLLNQESPEASKRVHMRRIDAIISARDAIEEEAISSILNCIVQGARASGRVGAIVCVADRAIFAEENPCDRMLGRAQIGVVEGDVHGSSPPLVSADDGVLDECASLDIELFHVENQEGASE